MRHTYDECSYDSGNAKKRIWIRYEERVCDKNKTRITKSRVRWLRGMGKLVLRFGFIWLQKSKWRGKEFCYSK